MFNYSFYLQKVGMIQGLEPEQDCSELGAKYPFVDPPPLQAKRFNKEEHLKLVSLRRTGCLKLKT